MLDTLYIFIILSAGGGGGGGEEEGCVALTVRWMDNNTALLFLNVLCYWFLLDYYFFKNLTTTQNSCLHFQDQSQIYLLFF